MGQPTPCGDLHSGLIQPLRRDAAPALVLCRSVEKPEVQCGVQPQSTHRRGPQQTTATAGDLPKQSVHGFGAYSGHPTAQQYATHRSASRQPQTGTRTEPAAVGAADLLPSRVRFNMDLALVPSLDDDSSRRLSERCGWHLENGLLQRLGQGPQFTVAFAEAQRRLLRPAVFCTDGESCSRKALEGTAELAMPLLDRARRDPGLQRQCQEEAKCRLGEADGGPRMAAAICALLA